MPSDVPISTLHANILAVVQSNAISHNSKRNYVYIQRRFIYELFRRNVDQHITRADSALRCICFVYLIDTINMIR